MEGSLVGEGRVGSTGEGHGPNVTMTTGTPRRQQQQINTRDGNHVEDVQQPNQDYEMRMRQLEEEERHKSVIIEGVKEVDAGHDREALRQLLQYLDLEFLTGKVSMMRRLGRINRNGRGKARLLKVVFNEKRAADIILEKAPRLSS